MDSRKYMVIDTSRRGTPKMFITSQVVRLYLADRMWHITFNTSPVIYIYRFERIKFFTKAERVYVVNHGFYLRNKHVENISEL